MNALNTIRLGLGVWVAASLMACGDGSGSASSGAGGGGTGGTGSATDVASGQGFWAGQVDAQTSVSTIALPDGTTWTVLRSTTALTTLVRATLSQSGNTFSVAGRSYDLATGTSSSVNAAVTLVPQTTLNVAASGTTPAYTLSYSKAYETPAKLSDATGRWRASRNSGAVQLTFDVSATGVLTGTSSTGCTYGGSLALHATALAVFNLSLTESCLGVAPQSYSGVATLVAGATGLSMAFTSADLLSGSVIQANR